MKSYIDKILNECGYKITNPAPSPATGNLYNVGAGEQLVSAKDKTLFHTTVAQCLYLAHLVASRKWTQILRLSYGGVYGAMSDEDLEALPRDQK